MTIKQKQASENIFVSLTPVFCQILKENGTTAWENKSRMTNGVVLKAYDIGKKYEICTGEQ